MYVIYIYIYNSHTLQCTCHTHILKGDITLASRDLHLPARPGCGPCDPFRLRRVADATQKPWWVWGI